MSANTSLRPPTPTAPKPLPVIHQQLGPAIPLTFFKLYAPSYLHCCSKCGGLLYCVNPSCDLNAQAQRGLFVKVSANDDNALMEFWDIEGPRADFENMKELELHQGIGARGGFRYEQLHESSVVDHLDIFGEALVRTPRLLSRLPTANLFLIDRQAPRGESRDGAERTLVGPGDSLQSSLASNRPAPSPPQAHEFSMQRAGARKRLPGAPTFAPSALQTSIGHEFSNTAATWADPARLKLEGVRNDG